jgi:arylsulfatase A-like enzyme
VALILCLLAVPGCRGSATKAHAPKPNVILYVIDGAAAERMSVYGYERRTTPYLELLAAEGAVFDNAYSNSSFTKTSVPSFMTSLHSSVLGGYRSATDPLPGSAVTMAERMRQAGYTTEVLTSNPYCGRISSLDRGVDIMRDTEAAETRPSSADLGREFWRLREVHPAEPFWVHFQSTDVHRPWNAGDRLAGLRSTLDTMQILDEPVDEPSDGPDRARLARMAGDLYDEGMAFQDRSLGRLVDRLKGSGEWGRTLFVVAADHSSFAAGLPFDGPGAPRWAAPVLASHKSHIPLVFVWPGKIAPGRRLTEQVSMIDVLPTILDLAGLPPLETAQGRSLAPLLLKKRGWKPRPVVFDEFYTDGEYLWGSVEVIDGRWGASLRIDTRPDGQRPPRERLRPAPLLVFDVEKDPHALKSLHEMRPDLAAKYSTMLERIWSEHRVLAKKFSRTDAKPLTREKAEALRSLGYIR